MSTVKIVVVDDDLASRNTIKSYLGGNREFEIVTEFSGGKPAIEWLRENEVDIVLCDMQMPRMNGVEFIQMLHAINVYIPVVAVSSFDDFEYARGCMVNGAADYLLKQDLDAAELVKVLRQVKERYHINPDQGKALQRIGYHFESDWDFTADNILRMIAQKDIRFDSSNIFPMAVAPDFALAPDMRWAEYKKDIGMAVVDMVAQLLGAEYNYVVHTTQENHLLLLISMRDAASYLFMMNTVSGFCDKLRRRMMRMLDTTLSIGVGTLCAGVREAIAQSRQLDDMVGDRYYLGGNRLFQLLEVSKLEPRDVAVPAQLWDQLEFELGSHSGTSAREVLAELLDCLETGRRPRGEVRDNLQRVFERMLQHGWVEPAQAKSSLEYLGEMEFFEQVKTHLLGLLSPDLQGLGPQAAYSSAVSGAVRYIERHFASDISLEDCAAQVGVGYTQLSREFKQQTGMRFVEYLNGVRIHRAKSLLIRGRDSMKEITVKAGFRNYNYFFRVFKEAEGITPKEYLAKIYSNP